MRIGGPEWIWILVIVILLFGAKKLPELARSIGASAKEFRKGIEEGSKEAQEGTTQNASTQDASTEQSSTKQASVEDSEKPSP